MNSALHNLIGVPEGMDVGELLPTFADVKHEVLIGRPNDECASCGKPFNEARKRRGRIRLFPANAPVPIVHQFYVCGRCAHLYRRGGDAKESVLVAVEAYFEDEGAQ